MRTRVYARCGLSTTDPQATPELIDGDLAAALRFISGVADWWWLDATSTIDTIAGTATIDQPDASVHTRSLAFTDDIGGEIPEIPIADLDAYTTDTGRPRYYAEEGTTLVLTPTPDAVYALKLRYVLREPDLAQDTSEPLIPAQYHDAVVDYAAYLCLDRLRDEDRAGTRFASYQQWEARMKDDARRTTKPKRARIRDGSFL